MNGSSPPPIPASEQATAFSHQAAKASWVCSFMVIVWIVLGSRTGMRISVELVALLMMLVGLLSGVIALFGIGRHGVKRILGPALVGILINGLLVFIFVTNFMAARAKAREAGKKAALPALLNPAGKKTDVAACVVRGTFDGPCLWAALQECA